MIWNWKIANVSLCGHMCLSWITMLNVRNSEASCKFSKKSSKTCQMISANSIKNHPNNSKKYISEKGHSLKIFNFFLSESKRSNSCPRPCSFFHPDYASKKAREILTFEFSLWFGINFSLFLFRLYILNKLSFWAENHAPSSWSEATATTAEDGWRAWLDRWQGQGSPLCQRYFLESPRERGRTILIQGNSWARADSLTATNYATWRRTRSSLERSSPRLCWRSSTKEIK